MAPAPYRAAIAACALAPVLLWIGSLAPSGGQAPPKASSAGVRVLYPPDRCMVRSGVVRLMIAAPRSLQRVPASLDGKPLALQRLPFAEAWVSPGALRPTAEAVGDRGETAVWVAQPKLAPGLHVASVAGRKLQLRVGSIAPQGWTQLYAHRTVGPDTAKPDCSGCHDMAGGALGAARTPNACAACHDEAAVQSIHSHVPQPFARCAMCHDPHGASRPKLLVDDKRKLCSRCHDAGHSKP